MRTDGKALLYKCWDASKKNDKKRVKKRLTEADTSWCHGEPTPYHVMPCFLLTIFSRSAIRLYPGAPALNLE